MTISIKLDLNVASSIVSDADMEKIRLQMRMSALAYVFSAIDAADTLAPIDHSDVTVDGSIIVANDTPSLQINAAKL